MKPQPTVAEALATLARETLSEEGRAALAALRLALAAPAPLAKLTRRQRQVASLLAEGVSNRGISVVLGIREGTAKLHVATVLNRLGVNSREEVAPLLDGAASSEATAELIGTAAAEGA